MYDAFRRHARRRTRKSIKRPVCSMIYLDSRFVHFTQSIFFFHFHNLMFEGIYPVSEFRRISRPLPPNKQFDGVRCTRNTQPCVRLSVRRPLYREHAHCALYATAVDARQRRPGATCSNIRRLPPSLSLSGYEPLVRPSARLSVPSPGVYRLHTNRSDGDVAPAGNN